MSGLICYLLLTEKCRKFVFDIGKNSALQKMAFLKGTHAPPSNRKMTVVRVTDDQDFRHKSGGFCHYQEYAYLLFINPHISLLFIF